MNLAEGLTLGLVYVVTIVSEGLGATWIGPERTYWPVLRLQKATLAAALTWYVSVALLSSVEPGILSRFIANAGGVVLVMLNALWTLYLIWRRNHVPAFLPINMAGVPDGMRLDYERVLRECDSAIRHGFIAPYQVEKLRADIDRLKAMTPAERAAARERAMEVVREAERHRRQRLQRRGGE